MPVEVQPVDQEKTNHLIVDRDPASMFEDIASKIRNSNSIVSFGGEIPLYDARDKKVGEIDEKVMEIVRKVAYQFYLRKVQGESIQTEVEH